MRNSGTDSSIGMILRHQMSIHLRWWLAWGMGDHWETQKVPGHKVCTPLYSHKRKTDCHIAQSRSLLFVSPVSRWPPSLQAFCLPLSVMSTSLAHIGHFHITTLSMGFKVSGPTSLHPLPPPNTTGINPA